MSICLLISHCMTYHFLHQQSRRLYSWLNVCLSHIERAIIVSLFSHGLQLRIETSFFSCKGSCPNIILMKAIGSTSVSAHFMMVRH